MKLLHKTTRNYILLIVPIVLIGMVLFFFLFRYFNLKHVEGVLIKEQKEIVSKSKKIKNYFIEDELSDELIVTEIPSGSVVEDKFSTVMVFDSVAQKDEPHRQLEMMQSIAGKNYKIIARKSLVENATLFYSIGISMLVLLVIIAISFVILNRKLSEKLWEPFYSTLTRCS